MATMFDIIQRAFRKIGVLAIDEPLTADAAVEGLAEMNAMMHGWKLSSTDIGHTTRELGDPFPLDPEFEDGTIFMLAARLSPEYTAPAPFDPDDWFRKFQAHYLVIPDVKSDFALRRTSSQRTYRRFV